jgi:hypothetical protein
MTMTLGRVDAFKPAPDMVAGILQYDFPSSWLLPHPSTMGLPLDTHSPRKSESSQRHWLEQDEAHGFAINSSAKNAGELLAEFELQSMALPPELEARLAKMKGLRTAGSIVSALHDPS